MKRKTTKLTLFILLPAVCLLAGCWTDPYYLKPATGAPAFAGSIVVVDSYEAGATVQFVDDASRQIVLLFADGTTSTNIAGPAVINFDQIKAGDAVKARIGMETGIFLIKNGPPPATADGVLIEGAAKGANPAGVLTTTSDTSARVLLADRSYRILKLKYADGRVKTFKVPLPFTLEHVAVGDDVVLRTTQTIALSLVPKKTD